MPQAVAVSGPRARLLILAWSVLVSACASGCGGGGGSPSAPAAAPAAAPTPPAPTPPAPGPAPAPAPAPAPGVVGGVVTAAVQATRLTGPAPLAVQFDASGTVATSATLPFHQLTYEFDFGDDRGLTWGLSGQPKNTQSGGPIAAHVFDNPGTYTVRVRARDAGGSVSETSVTITVQDPAAVYPGTRTVCVSSSGNFAGCPSGAAQRTSLPASYDGLRVLLRRGETFGTVSVLNTDDNAQIGAFGTGAKPSVAGVSLNGHYAVADWPDEVTVSDLNVGSGGVNLETTGSRILLYRNDIVIPSSSASQVNIGTAVTYYASNGTLPASSYYWPREIFLVENDIQGSTGGGNQGYAVMGWFMRSALLGNNINRSTYHSVRIWAAHKTILAHNFMGGDHYAPNPPGIGSALKLQARGTRAYTDSLGDGQNIATSQVVVANNRIGSSTFGGSWMSGVGPQNEQSVEAVMDYIHENNVHGRGPYTSQDLHLSALRATTRGNTVQGGGTFGGDAKHPSEWTGVSGMLPFLGSYFGQLVN